MFLPNQALLILVMPQGKLPPSAEKQTGFLASSINNNTFSPAWYTDCNEFHLSSASMNKFSYRLNKYKTTSF
jgi:hypothetical protein